MKMYFYHPNEMKYLKKFENHSQYESYIATDYAKPNVSICVQEGDVHYNPKTWADDYLTFVAKEDGTFTFAPRNSNVISYSTDNGTTWTQGNSVNINNGDKVMWRGDNDTARKLWYWRIQFNRKL